MIIKLNNKEYKLQQNKSLLDFLVRENLHEIKGTALAINGKVIPRSIWKETSLKENDNLLLITASQGG